MLLNRIEKNDAVKANSSNIHSKNQFFLSSAPRRQQQRYFQQILEILEYS